VDDAEFEKLLNESSLGAPHVQGESGPIPPLARAQMQVSSWRRELATLLGLDEPDGAQLRRIAEVAESLYDVSESRPWWEKAAAAGDRDAVDYLQILDEESNE
jgi:hypothetical protein